MKTLLIISALLVSQLSFAKKTDSPKQAPAPAANSEWQLQKSKITYVVIHPLHRVEGVSEQAKGKGVCSTKDCEFLIAAPVKSFDSGNSNRDAHMWQVTKAEMNPMATVSFHTPDDKARGKQKISLDVSLAGKTKTVPAEISIDGSDSQVHVTGEFTTTFSGFEMERPSLLSVPVKDDIRIAIDATWARK